MKNLSEMTDIEIENKMQKITKPYLFVTHYFLILFLLCLISSVFVWIWGNWAITWKLALTGIIGIAIFKPIGKGIESGLSEAIKQGIEKKNNKNQEERKKQISRTS